jgi:hypothetical protein
VLATAGSASRLSHVTLRHCGKADAGEGACLAILNKAAPVLQDVTVQDSGSAGVKLAGEGSAFGAASARLKVTGSAGYAVRMSSNEAGTLPADSSFTGNVPNAIELQGNITRTQTWPNPGAGASYVLKGNVYVSAINESPEFAASENQTTLTLQAGTVLRFAAKAALFVGYETASAAQLLVEGTEAEPVLFTADADSPTPGFWAGVNVGRSTRASHISHAIIEFAGAQAEGGPKGAFGENLPTRGNLNLTNSGRILPVITDVILRKGSGPGLYSSYDAAPDPTSGRWQVLDNGQYGVLVEGSYVHTLPKDTVYNGNTPNVVAIYNDAVFTATWPKLSVPYLITGVVHIGSYPSSTLTLEPGTEIQFAKESAIVVGFKTDLHGILIAKGTAGAPIRFVPDTNPFNSEYWGGLNFWYAEGSALEHVIVTDGGIEGSRRLSDGIYGPGNVNVLREIGSFIKNSRFERGYICGLSVSKGTRPGTQAVTTNFFDPANNNTFDATTGTPQCQY